MTWYIVQTNPQAERKAAAEIRRFGIAHGGGFRAYSPKWSLIVVNTRKGETKVRHRPLMPGYLFAQFPDGYYSDLSECQGVRRVVKNADGAPAVVPQKVIAALLRAQRDMKHEAEEARIYRMGRRRGAPKTFDAAMSAALFAGTRVGLVVAGPWAEKEVEIVAIHTDGMVEAKITLMGVDSFKRFRPLVEIVPVEHKAENIDETREAA